MRFVKTFWKCEGGVVESTLVIIPLMALFLLTLELVIAVNFRNIDLASVQSVASATAISSIVSDDDEVVSLDSGSALEKIRILITHQRRSLPQVLPSRLLGVGENRNSLDLSGIAVMERQR